ncbi:MAG: hypothetical protein K2Q10_07595, partial [Rhodospirillales bacterium]|nr:hypothetical protein [Rhodospirillales bacterium]
MLRIAAILFLSAGVAVGAHAQGMVEAAPRVPVLVLPLGQSGSVPAEEVRGAAQPEALIVRAEDCMVLQRHVPIVVVDQPKDVSGASRVCI